MDSNKHQQLLNVGIGMILGAIIAGGSYLLGAHSHSESTVTVQSNPAPTAVAATDAAQVINAADFYLASKGIGYGTNQVYDLQVVGNNARGKVFNNDSGSVFYAHKTDNRWQVVFAGQNLPASSIISQNNMPASWGAQTGW